MRHRAEVLHLALAAGQGEARQDRPVFHQARRRHGHLDRGPGHAQLQGLQGGRRQRQAQGEVDRDRGREPFLH